MEQWAEETRLQEEAWAKDTVYLNKIKREKQQKEDEGAARGNKPQKESIRITGGNMEGVLKRLEATPKGMSIINDELAGFFNALNMYRKGDDVQNYLSIWSNEDVDKIRKTDEDGYLIHNPFINIIGGIQTGTLKKIVSQNNLAYCLTK